MTKTVAPTSAASAEGVLDTIPKLLLRNARLHGDRPAMRHKDQGIWQTYTWRAQCDEVRLLALGLRKLGVERGDSVAIIGDNRPRLYWTFAAVQSLGGVPVPVYQDAVADEMAYVLEHAEVTFAVVHDQEQVDKLVSIADRCPRLSRVIYDDPRGLKDYDHARLTSYDDTRALGAKELGDNPGAAGWWLEQIAVGRGSDVSVMLYTSGTTGRPKGVVLSHDNVVKSSLAANAFDSITADDSILSYLPMAWVGDHIFSYGQAYAAAMCIACPESPETAVEDRREIGPTFFFAPPRVFEAMLTQMTVRMEDASRLKKRMFEHFMGVARRHGEAIINGGSVSPLARLQYSLGDKLVYAPLRNRMGFTNTRLAYTAGEAIGPELFQFYRSIGINLKQLYGQTEATVLVTMQPDGEVYPETVGRPVPGVELKFSDSGEVMFRSPGVFQTYFKNPEATATTKTPDGWVHSGDAGYIDSRNHLVIIDRVKDVGRLNDGAMFSPKFIENRVKFFPEIKEAVAFGHGRDFVTMFLNIDLTSVGNWAERNMISYGSYQELAGHPRVLELVSKRIADLNVSLAKEPRTADSQVRRFIVLQKELDADDGELTRTQKVRRAFIAERYQPLVKALYDGSKTAEISVEVVFEDGRKGRIDGKMAVIDAPVVAVAAKTPIREAAE